MKTTPAAGIALLALAVSGCIAPQNDRTTIGRSVQLEALFPVEQPSVAAGGAVLAEQTPTLISVVRSNWEPTVLLVPVDGTAHRPSYQQRVHLASSTARQRRDYPTSLTALELTGGSEPAQQLEALANNGQAVIDTALLIPSFVLYPPWRTRWSPSSAWDRYWDPEVTPAVQQIAPALIVPADPPIPPTAP